MVKTLEGLDTSDPKESYSYANVTFILACVVLGCAVCWTIPTLCCGNWGFKNKKEDSSSTNLIP